MQEKTKKICYINILYNHNTLRYKDRRHEHIAGISKNALLSVRSEGHQISGKNRENFLSVSVITPVGCPEHFQFAGKFREPVYGRGCFLYAACGFISDTGNFLNQPVDFFRGVDCSLTALTIPEITAVFHSAKTKISSKVSPGVCAREDIFVTSSTDWPILKKKDSHAGLSLDARCLFNNKTHAKTYTTEFKTVPIPAAFNTSLRN